jgi:acyl-CoA thioester hydrolase
MAGQAREARLRRKDFPRFISIATRWGDNDVYGHVNNVVYYAFFDTAVNRHLMENGALDVATSDTVGLVVSNSCTFFASVAFPETIEVGLRVERLGRSSVTYQLGVFRAGEAAAAAQGRFTHVYVTRADQRTAAIPEAVLRALEGLRVAIPPPHMI